MNFKTDIPHFARRFWGMVIGVVLMGLGLSLLIRANYGTDPYGCFCLGLSARTGLSFGTCELLVNGAMLLVVFFADRSRIGFGTIGNMVVVGYAADFFSFVWDRLRWFSPAMAPAQRAVLLVPALAVFTVAAAAYMTADLGMSPYDAAAFILAQRLPRFSYRAIRMVWDAVWVAGGWLLGGAVGLVTVLLALTIGPVVACVGRWIAVHVYQIEMR